MYVAPYWYYSRASEMGRSEKLGHVNMTMLSAEEEEEWEMNCKPGDLRVGFETERMPFSVTVVGVQTDYRIMPIRKEGKAHYILFEGKVDPKGVLKYIEEREGLDIQSWRYVCALAVFVGMLCRTMDVWPFAVCVVLFVNSSIFHMY